MRAGAYTIHQSLTAEAAAVLKLALGIARRRGHAQVTPLHVAFALLSPACSPPPQHPGAQSAPYGLLKRACLRSHPSPAAAAAAAHPLQCRALELCFNVALNRLPTSAPHSPPPSSSAPSGVAPFASSLIQPNPTLSNALVAALKRAQANQRRGCVELQQQPPPPPPPVAATAHQGGNQQQPLLAIKVELDQLIISILDDPSVSRVMREAGFSSSTVKSNLEEESALMLSTSSSSPPPTIPPHFFLDPSIGGNGGGGGFMLWPAQFLGSPGMAVPSCKEDVRAVLEVMVRKQGRRTNPVVVGDSVSMAEAVAGELLRRLEGGDVPDELAGAHLLKLQLSYVHVRLMSRADVDAKAAELRRSVDAVKRGGLVVYVGDLRWALDEDHHHNHNHPGSDHHNTASSYSPVDHMVAELGRLLGDLRASVAPPRGRVWLVATASYQTYMRCRRRSPSLESAWALQAVVVPTGSGTGLALNSLHPASNGAPMQQAMAATNQNQQQQQLIASPFAVAGEPTAFAAARDEQEDKLLALCTECSRNYEREASAVKAEAADEDGPRSGGLPGWLATEAPKENYLIELKRKWSRLCRKLHLCGGGGDLCSAAAFGAGVYGSGPSLPWWSASCLMPAGGGQAKPSIAGFLGMEALRWSPPPASAMPHRGMGSLREPECQDVTTALALGSLPISDSASSSGGGGGGGRAVGSESDGAAVRELARRLRKNVPWQRAAVAEIVDAVSDGAHGGDGRKGVWLLLKGNDHAAVRRAAAVIAETHCGGADRLVTADPNKFGCADDFFSDVVSRAFMAGGGKLVLVVGDVERAPQHVVDCLVAASRSGALKDKLGRELDLSDSIVVLTTSKLAEAAAVGGVISLRLYTPEESPSGDLKRKAGTKSPTSDVDRKRARSSAGRGLDLNLNLFVEDDNTAGNDDDDDAVPSDITHEGDDSGEHSHPHHHHHHHYRLLESIATRVVTLLGNGGPEDAAAAAIRERLAGQLDDGRELRVDGEAAEALAAARGHFVDEVLERWAAEVFEPAAATVKNGGKAVVLGVGPGGSGGAQESVGFMGSALPSRVHVD
ncbi:protein SMAX1-LIKE 4-like [Oryza brachyantha]|uniref:protein SMAX1-LIKE 4-like n=1 Tax=Oryza brachyantha TaxID=4533 RepID=UPI001AD998C7|nr:protein SMAX1-LIKE 4-like [Oryza brachyantha]